MLCPGDLHPSSCCHLPVCCPRCGLRQPLRGSHLDLPPVAPPLSQSHDTAEEFTGPGPAWQASGPPGCRGQQSSGRPPHVRSLSDSRDSPLSGGGTSRRRRTQSVGVATYADEARGTDGGEGALGGHAPGPRPRPGCPPASRPERPGGGDPAPSGPPNTADGSVRRRLACVSTELLCERAHSRLLARQRQDVAERERALSRKVDVAVMVIAALKEQLNASENELERREREVSSIHRFLAAAVRQETCGKVRVQLFIENLLRRIALAERLLEYHHGNVGRSKQQQQWQQPGGMDGAYRGSVGRAPPPCGFQPGGFPAFPEPARDSELDWVGDRERERDPDWDPDPDPDQDWDRDLERKRDQEQRERLARSSRLFCRPEQRADMWTHQGRWAGHQA